MIRRTEIINYINKILNSAAVADRSANGLQIEGKEEIKKIAFGVSAGAELFRRAVKAGADMIIVHHGLFWGTEQVITGPFKKRVEILVKNDVSLAAWHLPLDMNPALGNNAVLAAEIGLKNLKPFGNYHGTVIGFKGTLPKPLSLREIKNKLGAADAPSFNFGPEKIKTAALVSGKGYDMLPQAVEQGIDVFITGSVEEPVQEICREGKINFIALGHYASETRGIKKLMQNVSKKFKIETGFIDVENPF